MRSLLFIPRCKFRLISLSVIVCAFKCGLQTDWLGCWGIAPFQPFNLLLKLFGSTFFVAILFAKIANPFRCAVIILGFWVRRFPIYADYIFIFFSFGLSRFIISFKLGFFNLVIILIIVLWLLYVISVQSDVVVYFCLFNASFVSRFILTH
jgi:hypothetical protein